LFFAKATVNPLRKKFQFFLKNKLFSTKTIHLQIVIKCWFDPSPPLFPYGCNFLNFRHKFWSKCPVFWKNDQILTSAKIFKSCCYFSTKCTNKFSTSCKKGFNQFQWDKMWHEKNVIIEIRLIQIFLSKKKDSKKYFEVIFNLKTYINFGTQKLQTLKMKFGRENDNLIKIILWSCNDVIGVALHTLYIFILSEQAKS
jgi:hypothetical protein